MSGSLFLRQLDYEEKEVKPYKPDDLKALFQAADHEEKLWMSHFLDARGISRGHGPAIAGFKDPVGNILSVLEAA